MFNVLKEHRIIYAYLLGFIGVLCFAATLPLTTIALNDFSPAFITVIRAVIAGFAACLWVFFSSSGKPRSDEIKPLVVSGLGLVFGFPLAMAIG
ncbi:MAG TPA: EamA family transporter, partial [Gammaproteobacteria bacterium]|nr:EamA family transporter [Gammaproteobacteria bacterium]